MGLFKKLFATTDEDNEMEDIVIRDKNTGINLYSKKEEKKGMVNMNDLKYVTITLNSYIDAQTVLDLIKENRIVTFCLEKLSRDEGQRVVDIVAGARHMMNGKVVQVTEKVMTYLPNGISFVNMSEDISE